MKKAPKMFVKICGNTNLADALLAVDAGADAVGFVFAPSRRQMTADVVAPIVAGLPKSILKFGVFHTNDAAEIVQAVRAAGLTGVQIHGGLNPALVGQLKTHLEPDVMVVQVLHWFVDGDAADAEEKFRADVRTAVAVTGVDAVLLDTKTATAGGGTGRSFDWARARTVLDEEGKGLRVILAGGLTPENVAEAIRVMRPWGVDVASGTEMEPGKKDSRKVKAFVESVRAV